MCMIRIDRDTLVLLYSPRLRSAARGLWRAMLQAVFRRTPRGIFEKLTIECESRNTFARALDALLVLAAAPAASPLRHTADAAPPPPAQGLELPHIALSAHLLPVPTACRA